MTPTKCPAREKKMRQEKQKKRGGEKAKSKSLEILLSAHARTSQADILHVNQKTTKCTYDLQTALWYVFISSL